MIKTTEIGGRILWRLTLNGQVRHYKTEAAARGAATRLAKSAPIKAARKAEKAAFDAACRRAVEAAEQKQREREAWRREQLKAGVHASDIAAYLARN